MEIFKTDILKKEFQRFQKEELLEILKCDHCQKVACDSFHKKFLVYCKFCREIFCKSCQKFKIAKENLLSNVDEIGKEYIEKIIKDFLNVSDQTIQSNYKVNIERTPIQKKFKAKSYVKSNKSRAQVINQTFDDCEKIKNAVKGKSRTFYKKF